MWRVALTGATYPRDGSGSVGGVRGWQIWWQPSSAARQGGPTRRFKGRTSARGIRVQCPNLAVMSVARHAHGDAGRPVRRWVLGLLGCSARNRGGGLCLVVGMSGHEVVPMGRRVSGTLPGGGPRRRGAGLPRAR